MNTLSLAWRNLLCNQRRTAVGLSYTTGFNLTFTAEGEYNSAALDRDQWNALSGTDPTGPLRVLAARAPGLVLSCYGSMH